MCPLKISVQNLKSCDLADMYRRYIGVVPPSSGYMNTPLARKTKWIAGRFRILQSSGCTSGKYFFFDLSSKYLDYLILPFLLFSNRVYRPSLHKTPLNCCIVLTHALLYKGSVST
jgi:hypothetical protein